MTAFEPDDLAIEAAQIAEAQREPHRFAALYERNFDAVYAFVSRRVPDRSDAEDVTATVFQKALAGLGRFEWRGVPFAAWLIRIAANEIADRRPRTSAPLSAEAAAVDDGLADVERRAMVFGLVRTLPPDQRRVVLMRFGEDKTIREVAVELGRSEGAVKQLQFRALRAMRAQVGDDDG